MIPIKNLNVFTHSKQNGIYVINYLLNYFETMGLNVVYFYNESKPVLNNPGRSVKYTHKDIEQTITDNIFRADIIILDCYSNYSEKIKIVRDITDLPLIIHTPFCDKSEIGLFDTCYDFYVDYKRSENSYDDYMISSTNPKWTQSIAGLTVKHIRNEKINTLFKNESSSKKP